MISAPIKVKKYGGTSVGSVERICKVAEQLVEDQRLGNLQVVVLSAMGKTTDRLLEMASQVTAKPQSRELDMLLSTGEQVSIALLAMAVHNLGAKAISLTGAQCGIITNGDYSRARIQGIDTDRIQQNLEDNIVIVAGFQGVTTNNEITTLGRGGSDTTAAALAAALQSAVCQIYTDVQGVFTADPSLVPRARLLPFISYDEMLEYAVSGSKVLHPRCVEIAKRFDVPLEVRSSFENQSGTLIISEGHVEQVAITGVTGDMNIARIALTQVKDVPGTAARISQCLAEASINILLIIQGIRHDQSNDVSLIIAQNDADSAESVLQSAAGDVGAEEIKVDTSVAKVSVIGSGVASNPGVAARMFQSLAKHAINIELISSSEVRIACIISEDDLDSAVRAIHEEFSLEKLERRKVLPS